MVLSGRPLNCACPSREIWAKRRQGELKNKKGVEEEEEEEGKGPRAGLEDQLSQDEEQEPEKGSGPESRVCALVFCYFCTFFWKPSIFLREGRGFVSLS